MKKKKIFIITGSFALLIFTGAIYFLGLFRSTPVLVDSLDLPTQVSLELPENSNYRQGPNQCGPYAASLFLNTFKPSTTVNPTDMVTNLPWKLPRGYTHPRALESLLKSRIFNIQIQSYDVGNFTSEQKILSVQQKLANGWPVILLTHMYNYQHYITIVGYNSVDNEFYVYDPVYTRGTEGMTIDDNGELPGNRNISKNQLLLDWSQGGIFGFYSWYMISIQ